MEGFGRYKSMKDWNIKITKVCYKHHSISEVAEIVEKQQQQGSIFNFKLLYGECSYTDKKVMKVYIINFFNTTKQGQITLPFVLNSLINSSVKTSAVALVEGLSVGINGSRIVVTAV